MEIVQGVIAFFKTHWVEILAIIGAVDVILGIVVSWTPFTWDNNVYTILHKYVEKIVKKS